MVDAPVRDQPRAKTISQLAAMSKAERLRYDELRAVWHANLGPIATPQLVQVHEDLWEIVDSNRQDGDKVKGAGAIDAHPGLGKTTIAVAFGRDFHRRQIELYGQDSASGDQRIPVAYLALTGATTMWTLNSMLCRLYAHPGAESGNATQLAGRAADCILSCERSPSRRSRSTPSKDGRLGADCCSASSSGWCWPTSTAAWVADDLADYLYGTQHRPFRLVDDLGRPWLPSGNHKRYRAATVELLDRVKNDAAAEQARQQLTTALQAGRLSARPRSRAKPRDGGTPQPRRPRCR